MKKLIILLVVSISFTYFTLARTTTKSTTVLFNTDKYQLTDKATKELRQFIKSNLKEQDYQITIKGHTDNIGTVNYNKTLSLNRAKSVEKFLLDLGINQQLINMDYKGELDPKKPNTNNENRQENRRVEVTFTSYQFDNTSELEEAISINRSSIHLVDPKQEQVIRGKQGVKILFKQGSFIDENGNPVKEEVKVTLTEALDYDAFVSSRLATKCGDKLLESGGMLKIEAITLSGKPVQLSKDKPMVVAVPTKKRKKGMEVFSSVDGSDWIRQNQPIQPLYYKYVGMQPKSDPPKPPRTEKHKITLKLDRPREPRIPYKPTEPREESYIKKIPWYVLFNRKKIRASQERRYQAALDNYDRRLDRYAVRLERYQKKKADYIVKYKAYQAAVKDMYAMQMAGEDVFETDQSKEAYEKYKENYAKYLEIYQKRLAEWQEKRRIAMEESAAEMDKMGIASSEMVNNYVFEYAQFDWINCDRFQDVPPEEKQSVIAKTEYTGNERVLLLYKEITSMTSLYYNTEAEAFVEYNFPSAQDAVIFAYKVEDGKPFMCLQEIDSDTEYELEYKPTSLHEIKSMLQSFNKPIRS